MRSDSPDSSIVSPCSSPSEDIVLQSEELEQPERMPAVSQPIVVYSLDGDGCFLPPVTTNMPYCSIADFNESFLAEYVLKRLQNNNEHLIFLIGSARQDCLRDLAGMYQPRNGDYYLTESYFFALQKFFDHCRQHFPNLAARIELDPFLLDDVAFARKSGESFNMAVNNYGKEWSDFLQSLLTSEKKLSAFLPDEILSDTVKTLHVQATREAYSNDNADRSGYRIFVEETHKFALLYTQTHHIASRFPKNQIAFHFYDDRQDILSHLIAVFIHRADLLPKNIMLYLHHYINGQQQIEITDECRYPVIKAISGVGLIDTHYRDTLLSMAALMEEGDIVLPNLPNVRLPCVCGNPLQIFFSVILDKNNFRQGTVISQPVLEKFETERHERLIETPSLTNFFEEMHKVFDEIDHDCRKEAQMIQGMRKGFF